jgi:NADPH:quinone reductase-like Zn-dependent oxidoreductase
MRTVALHDFGRAPELTDLPAREPGPGELAIRVRASSVNGFDMAVVAGWIMDFMEYRFPVVLGKDFAGTVEQVGDGVDAFGPGDEVFGVALAPYLDANGSFAEHLTMSAQYGVARIPAGVDLAVAGALGLAGSAARACLDALQLKAGHTVLLCGATGGVGSIALQYAAASGVRVIATARPGEEADLVRDLGAEETVDYAGDLSAGVRAVAPEGVDAVLHLAGDPRQLVDLLAPGGCLASTLMFGADQHPSAVSVTADPSPATLDRLAADVAGGRIRVPISRTYALADVPQALADFPAGTLGKYAVRID